LVFGACEGVHAWLAVAGLDIATCCSLQVLLYLHNTLEPLITFVLPQDEMKALQRLNTAYFLSGYLGFTATWLLSLIARIMGKQPLAQATDQIKGLLRCVSPHYCFAQGLYDITSTYQGAGEPRARHHQ
jgi:hypothetical protein